MRQCHVLAGAFVFALLSGGLAHAQDSLPGDIINAPAALATAQQKIVTDFLERQIKQMIEGNPQESAAARGRLIDAYIRGASDACMGFYDPALATRLIPATEAKTTWAKLNAQIVAKYLRGQGAVPIIKAGMSDKMEAVRYPAVIGGKIFTGNEKVSQADKEAMLPVLLAALKEESKSFMLEHLYIAIVNVGKPEAIDAVLMKVNERVALHFTEPETPAEAEYLALEAALGKLVRLNIGTANVPAQPPKEKSLITLSLVAVRYIDLVTQAEMAKKTAELNRSVYPQIQVTSNNALQWAGDLLIKNFNYTFKLPKDSKGLPLPDVRLLLTEWKEVLTQDLKVKPAELQLQPPAPAGKPETTAKP